MTRPVPDFLRITKDTAGLRAVFFEIEAPRKPLARRDGGLRAEYHQAMRQISAWRRWLADPAQLALFRTFYRLDRYPRPADLTLSYVLIYGRRGDLRAHPDALAERNDSRPPLTESMTFDHLRPSSDGRFDLGVSVRRGRFISRERSSYPVGDRDIPGAGVCGGGAQS